MRFSLLILFLVSCTSPEYSQETAKQVDEIVAIVDDHIEDERLPVLKYRTQKHSESSPTGVDPKNISFLAGLAGKLIGLDPALITSILTSFGFCGYGAVKHVAAKRSNKEANEHRDNFHKERARRFGAMHPDKAEQEEI